MATHQSAEKAARQAAKRNSRNTAARSTVKTAMKNLRAFVENKKLKSDELKKATDMLTHVQKIVMKAASKKLIKKETASRYISRLSVAVHKAAQQ